MHCWGFVLAIYSCLIISSVVNDNPDDLQECPGGFCARKDQCPYGIYDEANAQTSGIIVLRNRDNVCRHGKVCCKNESTVHTNEKCQVGFCVLKDLCPNGTYVETTAQSSGILMLRNSDDNVCRDNEVCCNNDENINPNETGNEVEDSQTYVKHSEYPWVVTIWQEETFLGGGTLVHPRFVLTAAHILTSKNNLHARFGYWNMVQGKILPKQNIEIRNTIHHPEFQSESLHNDIALAQLKQDVLYDTHLRPISLPSPSDLFDDQLCISTSWGNKHTTKTLKVTALKRVELPVIPRKRCKELFAATRLGEFFRLHRSFLCAGAIEGVDTCYGDAGSGLFCPTESESYVLAGIVSWGLSCGQQDVPGAYVNVAKFVTWINSTIAENE
ncbi:inactive CLIP domain-containing serine protease A8-like [Anopheles moucheti]|uniref:inactive CLIP domain-containing serine protease A8-like n=1 Tax=Anopheles moucheti TaxID=186751 RepID=UPI0022F0688F|nr:inactive CLIP domain-containing serine protease A8-like [Anopheles moucheti]